MLSTNSKMSAKKRILIVTAAFGEGHNSAARNLAIALEKMGVETRVADPCVMSAPHSTAVIQWGYRLVTTHFPRIWEKIYRATDQCDFSQPSLPLMRPASPPRTTPASSSRTSTGRSTGRRLCGFFLWYGMKPGVGILV